MARQETRYGGRMLPDHGGTPVPFSPVVTPCVDGPTGMKRKAEEYCAILRKELAAGEDGTPAKWSARQRVRLRAQLAKWQLRAEGQDAQYQRHGTHPRMPEAPPPDYNDHQIMRLRRDAMAKGTYETNQAHWERNHYQDPRLKILKRWKAEAEAKAGKKGPSKAYNEDGTD